MPKSIAEGFETIAEDLLLLAATAAPWYGGARLKVEWAWMGLAGLLSAAFIFVVMALIIRRRRPVLPIGFFAPIIILLSCLVWWLTQKEPAFASSFRKEQWEALLSLKPDGFLVQPWNNRLWFEISLLLGAIAAMYLGRHATFRRNVTFAIGWSGMAAASYALGERWWDWPHPPWSMMVGNPVRTHAAFFHYSAIAACVNLAWPLLVFRWYGVHPQAGGKGYAIKIGVLVISGFALSLWSSSAGVAVAVSMLLAGAVWWILARFKLIGKKRVMAAITLGFLFLAGIQAYQIHSVSSKHPDGWVSSENLRTKVEDRAAIFRKLSATRGDRLIPSAIPDRPSAWLAASRMAGEHPWIGLGPGSWSRVSGLYTSHPTINSFFHYLQFAHHDILQAAAEWGIFPTLAMIWLWGFALWKLSQSGAGGGVARSGIMLALLGVAVHGLVDFPLQVPGLKLWAMLLIGIACSAWETGGILRPAKGQIAMPDSNPVS